MLKAKKMKKFFLFLALFVSFLPVLIYVAGEVAEIKSAINIAVIGTWLVLFPLVVYLILVYEYRYRAMGENKGIKIITSVIITNIMLISFLSITKVVAPNQIFSEMTWGWGKAYIFYIISMHSIAFGIVAYFVPDAITFIGKAIKYYIPCRIRS